MKYLFNAAYLVLLLAYLPVILFQRLVNGKKRPGLWHKLVGRGPQRATSPRLSSGSGHPEFNTDIPATGAETLRQRVLFHAVSLGEVSAIRNLVCEFRQSHPDWEVLISTTTQTGLDAARKQFPDLEVCLLPFDFSWSVRRFLKNLQPDLLILAELEIWPNLLRECRRQSIATCLVNARLSQPSCEKYRRLIRWIGNLFLQLDLVGCQNEIYASRFRSLGVPADRIVVTGNLKYDGLLTDRRHPRIQELATLVNNSDNRPVLIAGSTQAPEEEMVLDAFLKSRNDCPDLRLLLCPRHPERFDEVAALIKSRSIPFSRRSQLEADTSPASPVPSASDTPGNAIANQAADVVLLDCMGELRYWWGLGDVAFVGGSFGNRGGQNMIEPLALGNAVCFGPHTRNFVHEVTELKRHGAAVQLNSGEELQEFIAKCLAEPEYQKQLIEHGKSFLAEFSPSSHLAWQATLEAIDRRILADDSPKLIAA